MDENVDKSVRFKKLRQCVNYFLSLIMIVEHFAIWNEGTIFSKLYILPKIKTLCVILEKLTKLIIHVYLELSAQSQYHSFLKKYNIA